MAREQNGYHREDLGEGYFVRYRDETNGFGGLYPAELTLWGGDGQCIRKLTDEKGEIIDFPGILPGKWSSKLEYCFWHATRYNVKISDYTDGIFCFGWQVQPDGRYWADEDGFGAEDDEEIWLYAVMDQYGRFITKFMDTCDDRFQKMNILW